MIFWPALIVAIIALGIIIGVFAYSIWKDLKDNGADSCYSSQCRKDPNKRCPVKEQFTISGPGILHVPSKAHLQCCKAQDNIKALQRIKIHEQNKLVSRGLPLG